MGGSECTTTEVPLSKAEGKGPVVPVATRSGKSSLRLSILVEGYLPVAFGEVQCRDIPGSSQPVQQLVHPRHGVSVKLGDLVEATEDIAEAEGAVRFRDHQDWAGPWAA